MRPGRESADLEGGLLRDEVEHVAVDVPLLDVEYLHAVLAKEWRERFYREVGQMLVIDGVVLVVLKQVDKVRSLENEHAALVQEHADAIHERIEVVNVGEDVGRGGD